MSEQVLGGSTLAALLVEQNHPLEVAEVRLPEQLICGQVLVKVDYSGICGSQLGEIDGVKGPDPYLPHLLGHEGSAEVLATGPSVTTVSPGDRVVMHWRPGLGIQAEPAKYKQGNQTVQAGWVTTFNRHAVVSENRVTKISDDFDHRLAPLFGCAVTTGFGVVENDARLRPGESVVVLGTGGVGLNVVQAASLCSAYPVIAVDRIAAKLELAKQFGATHLFASKDSIEETEKEVLSLLEGKGADVVIETTGVPSVVESACRLAGGNGRVILVGVSPVDRPITICTLPLHFGMQLKGSHGGDAKPDSDIPRLQKLHEAGYLKLTDMITHEFPLEKVNEAIEVLRFGDAGKVLLNMGE